MVVEHIRLSQRAKEQLIKLKRITGIEHWNVLCRWAFCLSLSERTIPPLVRVPADSNVEMSWRVFGGRYADLYVALLKERCERDGLGTGTEVLAQQFRLHLHRGIAYLAGNRALRRIDDLLELAATRDGECQGFDTQPSRDLIGGCFTATSVCGTAPAPRSDGRIFRAPSSARWATA